MTFGEKLKELREAAELTQTALADTSGVPIGTIRDYEQAKRTPLLSTAFKLSRALGVSVESFASCIDGEESKGKRKPIRGRPRKEK